MKFFVLEFRLRSAHPSGGFLLPPVGVLYTFRNLHTGLISLLRSVGPFPARSQPSRPVRLTGAKTEAGHSHYYGNCARRVQDGLLRHDAAPRWARHHPERSRERFVTVGKRLPDDCPAALRNHQPPPPTAAANHQRRWVTVRYSTSRRLVPHRVTVRYSISRRLVRTSRSRSVHESSTSSPRSISC